MVLGDSVLLTKDIFALALEASNANIPLARPTLLWVGLLDCLFLFLLIFYCLTLLRSIQLNSFRLLLSLHLSY